MTKLVVNKGQLTEKQRQEVREAKKKPIVFDEDCPELSPAMMKVMKSMVTHRNRRLTT